MKTSLFKIILVLSVFFSPYFASAQNQSSVKTTVKLDQNAQVRGADGMEYPYAIWYKLFQTGKYGVKLVDSKNPSAPIFLIYELSEQEIILRNERMPKPRESGSFKNGDSFKTFNFKDEKGDKFKAEDWKGKIIVLNFWFINCPPCRNEMPDLNNLVAQYKDRDDIIFLAFVLDESYLVKDFLKKSQFNYHQYANAKFMAERYGVKSYPTHVVINKEGKVVFNTSGLAPNTVDWIKKSIDLAVAE